MERVRRRESRDGKCLTQRRVADVYSRVKYYLSIRIDFHSSNAGRGVGGAGGATGNVCAIGKGAGYWSRSGAGHFLIEMGENHRPGVCVAGPGFFVGEAGVGEAEERAAVIWR